MSWDGDYRVLLCVIGTLSVALIAVFYLWQACHAKLSTLQRLYRQRSRDLHAALDELHRSQQEMEAWRTHLTTQFHVPNLDRSTDDDLCKHSDALALLHSYCQHSLVARRARKVGNLQRALEAERTAMSYYDKLPANFRW